MSKRSEKALDDALEHWFRVRDKNEGVGPKRCKLCNLYQHADGIIVKCPRCPVHRKTKTHACIATPYGEYAMQLGTNKPKRKRLAQAEIEFLQSCYY